MDNVINTVRQQLKEKADEKTKKTSQNYFKETIKAYGVKVPVVNQISKKSFALIKELPPDDIYALCEILWQSAYLEESVVACNWSYYIHDAYQPDDFLIFEKWVGNYVNNWASCDTLCNHTIGSFIKMYPQYLPRLKQWAMEDNRWMRRAAAVTLIIPAREGLFLSDVFDLANILLMDKDDLVQKGYGWMLKVASQVHQKEVFDFVMSKKDIMPRTALRYAIEKMPADLKAKAMAK